MCDIFGRRPGFMAAATQRAESDPVLAGLVKRELADFTADVALHALEAVLEEMRAVALAERQEGVAGKGRGGMPTVVRYLAKALPNRAADIVRQRDAEEAKNRTEKLAQERVAAKRLDGIERGGARGGRMSAEEAARRVFGGNS